MDMMKPAEIEAKARAMGLSINEMCRRAGVTAGVFHTWKRGAHEPNMKSYKALVAVVEQPREPEAAE